jgi:hypothetical protein
MTGSLRFTARLTILSPGNTTPKKKKRKKKNADKLFSSVTDDRTCGEK